MNNVKSKFTYNDGVIVNENAPSKFHPGEDGVICGMNMVISEAGARKYMCDVNDWIYIVEFADGSSIEIAECYLEEDPDRLKYCLREQVVMKNNISEEYHPSEIVSIMNYHRISEKSVADKFNMNLDDVVYILQTKNGEQFLSPESFIEKKYTPL